MLNEFNKYKFIKKSESELASDEIINSIFRKLWNDSGYEEYIATYGDTQYTFNESEIDEICTKFNQVGCTSFQLSKEELLEIIEKPKEYS